MTPAEIQAQAQKLKLDKYEGKRVKTLEEYNHYITHKADPIPITKISYKINNSTKEAIMRITRNDNSLNLTVYDKFVLKMLGFSEWIEVHALASKRVVKGLTACKASASNLRRIQVKDIVKEVEDYLNTYSSAGMDISCKEVGLLWIFKSIKQRFQAIEEYYHGSFAKNGSPVGLTKPPKDPITQKKQKPIASATLPTRQYERRVNKRQMQTQESKIDMGKALDADLVDTESIRTDSTVQDDNSRSGNDTDADDADIRPIYDEEPMAEVQLTAGCNIFAIGQQHTEQPKIINEGQHGQILNETSNKAKIEKEIDVLETMNIELEHSVATLRKENV
ncbi:hypothetical protein Tco_1027399 [Tanacetum coccineum]